MTRKSFWSFAFIFAVCVEVGIVGCRMNIPKTSGEIPPIPSAGWRLVDVGNFTINLPPGWKFQERQGIDSHVGEFVGQGMEIRFDEGGYSYDFRDIEPSEYVVTYEIIGGYSTKVVSRKVFSRRDAVIGIYFPKIPPGWKLGLYSFCSNETQQDLVLKIFRTIKFKMGPK